MADPRLAALPQPRQLRFSVAGRPVPQGSMKSFRAKHTSRIVTLHSNAKPLAVWRGLVTAAALGSPGWATLDAACRVDMVFRFRRPKAHYRTGKYANELKASAPRRMSGGADIDKLARAVNDALTAAGVFDDDRRVAEMAAVKRWCLPGEEAGCSIVVTELLDEEPLVDLAGFEENAAAIEITDEDALFPIAALAA